MTNSTNRNHARNLATERRMRVVQLPADATGLPLKVSEYFGENCFSLNSAHSIPTKLKKELAQITHSGKPLPKEYAEVVARELTEWALSKGCTHFCHWFQPLTGTTAEKHDAFLTYDAERPIEKFSASQLMQGEPDASSFPNGGSRSTFEARGYTAWDLTSPVFIKEGQNGKTLCIPTAFVSYDSDALDLKTPLLRSISVLDQAATKFMQLTGSKDTKNVFATCGAEQEYFLVDKAFYALRPDLVMSGRTLMGSLTTRNQQLEDHYFGTIPTRVLNFMQELEIELYKLGIPAKTRHNEVAPGQFELASIYQESNVTADQNQLVMAMMKEVAERHDFVAILHEKPFSSINGSGKHLNWSMADNLGQNLLEPGKKPEQNHRFLTLTSIIMEAVYRHAKLMRVSISGHSNDHRLGANEAPPSVISIFLGDTLDKIFSAIKAGKNFSGEGSDTLDLGADQLVRLMKDNTDRNRTSPFAFTGNKFEFRAVGSSQPLGLPLSVLNTAVAEVLNESNQLIESELNQGKTIEEVLTMVSKKWVDSCFDKIVFNGDGYSEEWLVEAERRGLPNLKTTPDALAVLKDEQALKFLTESGVFRPSELKTRYNVLLERYITQREIEFETAINMIEQHVLPAAVTYKKQLVQVAQGQKALGMEPAVEKELLAKTNFLSESLYSVCNQFKGLKEEIYQLDHADCSMKIANKLMPELEKMADLSSQLEDLLPDDVWPLPKYLEMLFLR